MENSGNLVEIKSLSKSYKEVEALRGISLDIKQGEIFALIGPNGAGKTTTLRILATLLRPSSGDAFIKGISITKNPLEARSMITYLPDEAGAYRNMTGAGYLNFLASLYISGKAEIERAVKRGCDISGLGSRLDDKISTYSKGMTRKLLIARAVMTEPVLAILDEPTSGLDIINGLEIRNTLRSLRDNGVTLLVSSHNMLEIEYISDRVAIIDKGVIMATGTPDELKRQNDAANLEEVFARIVQGESA